MTIAIVGGSGFIGSHIIDRLVAADHEVINFDIQEPKNKKVTHIYVDILDPTRVNIALTFDFDAVYILAAMANVNDVYRNPVEATMVNVQSLANILEACRRVGTKRVIFASTVWIYEAARDKEPLPLKETAAFNLSKINHLYTAEKLSAEMLIQAYNKLYNLPFTILRYGIPYGPRGRRGTLIYNFLNNATKGHPLTINGDGSQTRNFIYVEDLALGNLAALQPQAANQIYNLEGLQPVSIKEIAQITKKLIPKTKIVYQPARPGDFSGRPVSREKAKKELGWEPKTDIEAGIKKYFKWLKSLPK